MIVVAIVGFVIAIAIGIFLLLSIDSKNERMVTSFMSDHDPTLNTEEIKKSAKIAKSVKIMDMIFYETIIQPNTEFINIGNASINVSMFKTIQNPNESKGADYRNSEEYNINRDKFKGEVRVANRLDNNRNNLVYFLLYVFSDYIIQFDPAYILFN